MTALLKAQGLTDDHAEGGLNAVMAALAAQSEKHYERSQAAMQKEELREVCYNAQQALDDAKAKRKCACNGKCNSKELKAKWAALRGDVSSLLTRHGNVSKQLASNVVLAAFQDIVVDGVVNPELAKMAATQEKMTAECDDAKTKEDQAKASSKSSCGF